MKRGGTWTCVGCGFQSGGRQSREKPSRRRYPAKGRPRKAAERVPVIRGLNGGEVAYRYFGESHGLSKKIDLSKAEGFKGTGSQLSEKLGLTDVELADALHLSLDELTSTSYDISKD